MTELDLLRRLEGLVREHGLCESLDDYDDGYDMDHAAECQQVLDDLDRLRGIDPTSRVPDCEWVEGPDTYYLALGPAEPPLRQSRAAFREILGDDWYRAGAVVESRGVVRVGRLGGDTLDDGVLMSREYYERLVAKLEAKAVDDARQWLEAHDEPEWPAS